MNIILVHLTVKYNADWMKIFNALDKRERVDFDHLSELSLKVKDYEYVTIIDSNYPKEFKLDAKYHPPFVLWKDEKGGWTKDVPKKLLDIYGKEEK